MKKDLWLQILSEKATPKEKEEFYHQLDNDKSERELFYKMKGLWLKTSKQPAVDVDLEFEDLWKRIKQENRKKNILGFKMFRYAAVIILLLGIGGLAGYLVFQNTYKYPGQGMQKYTAMRGSVSIVEFPDGTKIWLNSESELKFREDLKNKQRFAELSGEAYFEVAHREDFPMVVKVGSLLVRDLGTTFNIKAYPEDNYIETALVEGKVDIVTQTGNPIIELAPGESAVYHIDENKMEIRAVADNVLSAWRDGKFVIRDQRLEDIFKDLSRWYGIEFKFQNDELKDYRFTGNIKK